MLTKPNRLTEDKAIIKTLRIGRRINHAAVSLVFSKTSDPHTKIAVVVGTKVDKRAVVRNRLKRRTREALRPLAPRLTPGVDIVVFPRLPLGDIPFAELKALFADLLTKARLLI